MAGGAPSHERTGVGMDRQTEQGSVTKVDQVDCADVNVSQPPPNGDTSTPEGRSAQEQATGKCEKATVEVTSGPHAGRTFTEIVQPDASRKLHQGQGVVVAYARTRRRNSSTPSPTSTGSSRWPCSPRSSRWRWCWSAGCGG